jgi:hypothetical protein
MKTKVGELNRKAIVTCIQSELNREEILYIERNGKVILKSFNSKGELEPITREGNPIVTNTVTIKSENITGPSHWIQNNKYIFYVERSTDFKVVSNDKDITHKARLVALGLDKKVYELHSKYFSSISIEEI